LHPGVVRTKLSRHERKGLGLWAPITRTLLYPILCVVTKTPEEGAQTTLHCALSDDIVSGAYYR
jgi:retinol dehydrogenase-12